MVGSEKPSSSSAEGVRGPGVRGGGVWGWAIVVVVVVVVEVEIEVVAGLVEAAVVVVVVGLVEVAPVVVVGDVFADSAIRIATVWGGMMVGRFI